MHTVADPEIFSDFETNHFSFILLLFQHSGNFSIQNSTSHQTVCLLFVCCFSHLCECLCVILRSNRFEKRRDNSDYIFFLSYHVVDYEREYLQRNENAQQNHSQVEWWRCLYFHFYRKQKLVSPRINKQILGLFRCFAVSYFFIFFSTCLCHDSNSVLCFSTFHSEFCVCLTHRVLMFTEITNCRYHRIQVG